MRIHVCGRCEGCGYVVGGFRWEVAWSRWAPGGSDTDSLLEAQPCPDCGGTGALIELDEPESELALPSRRGLPVRYPYVRHVRALLRSQPHRD